MAASKASKIVDMALTVTVRCIACKKKREEGPNADKLYVPLCECGNVMVAVLATARRKKP